MKQVLLLLLICNPLFAIAQFYDDFSGNSFPNSPHWQGNIDAFELTADSLLQSKTILTTYLSAKNTLAYNVVWEFGISLGFNPSTNNQLRIYLIADRDSLTKPLNGYFIQIGESGSADRYQLYKQEGEKISLIMSSPPKRRTDPLRVNSRIRVSRDSVGNWKLYTALNNQAFTLDAFAIDNDFVASKFFGIHCSFTTSNSDKFGFDYFKIDTLIESEVPPSIISTRVVDSNSLEITFNKKLDSTTASQPNHYVLAPDYESPETVLYMDSVVVLSFIDSLITNNYTLHIGNIADSKGNIMADTSVIFYYDAPVKPDSQDTIPPKLVSITVLDSASIQLTFNEVLNNTPQIKPSQFTLEPDYDSPHIQVNGSIVRLLFTDSLVTNNYSLSIRQLTDLAGNKMKDTTVTFHYEAAFVPNPWYKLRPDSIGEVFFIDTFQHILSSSWRGQVKKFTIENKVLKQRDAITSPAFIHVPNTETSNRMWEAGIEVNNNLTSRNYVRLYLSAVTDSLPGNHQGYYLQIDGSDGNHVYKLVRQNTLSSRTIIFESLPIVNQYDKLRTRVRVSCDISGKWKIYTDEYDQNNFSLLLNTEGDSSVTDNTYPTSLYTGWMTRFSKTRIKDYALHYFLFRKLTDIPPIIDSIPPKVLSVSVVDSVSIQLIFSETLDSLSASNINHYSLGSGKNSPETCKVKDSIVVVHFAESLIPGDYILTINNILDQSGNQIEDNTSVNFTFREHYEAKLFDIIINEIMADPNPAQGLPAIEYLELRNLSDHNLQLKDWTYSSKSRTYQFDSISIRAHSYLLLYKESDSALTNGFGESIGLSPWPSLVNDGTTLTLKNEYGKIIDVVSYESSWYGDSKKNKGGWSLERIDPYAHCGGKHNWKASIDPKGGTPGKINATNQENTSSDLQLIKIEITEPSQVQLTFNKMLDPYSATIPNTYEINNGMGTPDSIHLLDRQRLVLFYPQAFSRGKYYQINVSKISDCAGQQASLTRELFYPDTISMHDIIINEILPDPLKGGVEFVEIYNNSEKTVDLVDLSLATIRTSNGDTTQNNITTESHLMYPATYRLLSIAPDSVLSHYFSPSPDVFIKMHAFPALINSGGTIALLAGNTLIDRLDYREDMHDPLIIDSKGVSLERVKFNTATNAEGNFKSAAAAVGGATPGYQNSQFQEEEGVMKDLVYLSSKTFSPDNDGFEDLMEINYQFPEGGKMATIEIYNDKGMLIKRLRRNYRLATQGTIHWDGIMDNNSLAGVGIYLILIEIYDTTGMRKLIRRTCVLASKF